MKKKLLLLCMAMLLAVTAAGGGKKAEEPEPPKEEEPAPTPEPVPEEEPEEEEPEPENTVPEGMAKSYLTGEWIDETIAGHRPYAIMIGNTVDALPQYGISNADVIYEVPVEGSITRLMAIFQDVSGLEKIGSTRSCRHYFVYFAKEFDAIYVHYGQAIYAEPLLAREDIHNINGMDSSIEPVAFYRDDSRKAPHNVFTSEEKLAAAVAQKGYRTEYAESYQGHFKFAEDDTQVELKDGADALVVSPGYFINKPWFVYNEEEGVYERFAYKQEHMDAASETQMKCKNIIVQYCNWEYADENGYLNIKTIPYGEYGVGKYITNGKMIDITWTKENEDSPARYFDASGNEITINQGKTWVCIARDKYQDRFHVYQTVEELSEARAQEQD